MRAVFLDLDGLDDLDLSPLEQSADSFQSYMKTTPEQVAERIVDADVVIVNKVVLSAELLRNAPSIKAVCVAATGTNNVDLEAALKLGIKVYNCQGYGTSSVVQHTISMMLALHTRLIDYQQAATDGKWQRSSMFCLLDYPIQELAGKTLGIVGFGALGQGVAKIAEAFGMKVLVAQRPGGALAAGRVSLEELLPQVDVLSLHCPLTAETENLINAEQLSLMKPGAFLVNAARGGIVNEVALRDVLVSGHLGGAATDVLSVEPPKEGNVLLDPSIPNLIVTPHCAWGSKEARQTIVQQTAENISNHFSDASNAARRVC